LATRKYAEVSRRQQTLVNRAVVFANLPTPPKASALYEQLGIVRKEWRGEIGRFTPTKRRRESSQRIAELHRWLRRALVVLGHTDHEPPPDVIRLRTITLVADPPKVYKFREMRIATGLRDVAAIGSLVQRGGRESFDGIPLPTSLLGFCAYAITLIADPDRPFRNQLRACRGPKLGADKKPIYTSRDRSVWVTCDRLYWWVPKRNRPKEFCGPECRKESDRFRKQVSN